MVRFLRDERFLKLAGTLAVLSVTLLVFMQGASVVSRNEREWRPSRTMVGSKLVYELAPSAPKAPASRKEKATFVTLARNSDLWELLPSILNIEDRFNKKYNYDWVFLNDEPFSDEFKEATTALISGKTHYGLVPKDHWSFPDWIDLEKAKATRERMAQENVIYGDSISYRFMCRYESGLFYQHELMQQFEWYWRVEPGVQFYCDIDYDIFKFMRENGKKYGFTISIHEYQGTIPTLWQTSMKFLKENPQYLHKNNMLDFVSDDKGDSYNLCHFWSNFEIGSLDFLRGDAYNKYFEYLDQSGGFFYERWGDAPVHSIAVSLFLDRNEIHHFDDIGYFHNPFTQCPIDETVRNTRRCSCNPEKDFTWKEYSCTNKFYDVNHLKKPDEWYLHAN